MVGSSPAGSETIRRARKRALMIIGIVLAIALIAAGGAFVLTRDSDNDDGPESVAGVYLTAWEDGDYEAMSTLVADPPGSFADEHESFIEAMQVESASFELDRIEATNDDAFAWFNAELELATVGAWSYEGRFRLRRTGEDDAWQVQWSATSIHPAQQEDQRLAMEVSWPERGVITDEAGDPLVSEREATLIGIEPRRMDGNRRQIKNALQRHVGVPPADVDAALDAPGVQPDHLVEIITIPQADYNAVRDQIYEIPGLVFRQETLRMGPTGTFARHVLGQVGEITAEQLEELGPPYAVGDLVGQGGLELRFERELAGLPSGEITLVDSEGTSVETLEEIGGREPQDVTTTIDPAVQRALDASLASVNKPAGAVVVDRDGMVRAVASRPLDEAFNRALAGSYAPGSTFKVVSTDAFLTNGLRPDTEVQCPRQIVSGGREFTNFEDTALGNIPFRRAFADSCNTAFVGASEDLPASELVAAAERFGFNTDYSVGLSTVGAEFPEPADTTEQAAATIGQGRVLASPLHMATVGAAVIDGTWEAPTLLIDPPTIEDPEETSGEGPDDNTGEEESGEGSPAGNVEPRQLDPDNQATLNMLMQLVVNDGSGTEAAVPGATVGGKTGTAEFGEGDPLPTHAWFIGFRGDLAIALVIEDGGVGGRVAAPVAGQVLSALPD